MAFTHLHVHTEYSLLDGSNKIKEYVKRVKELGMTAAAITDHGVMYGVIDFYRAAKEAGIRPIIGCEVNGAFMGRFVFWQVSPRSVRIISSEFPNSPKIRDRFLKLPFLQLDRWAYRGGGVPLESS